MKIRDKWIRDAKIDKEEYSSMYNDSIENNDNFWKKEAKRINWSKRIY